MYITLVLFSLLSAGEAFLLKKWVAKLGVPLPFLERPSPVISLSETGETKFCVNCKFYMNSNVIDPRFGKCRLALKNKNNSLNYYVVTGISDDNPPEYHFCSIVRDDPKLCGIDAKNFQPKEGVV
jgi:hypothetical protein